ncbi:MAG: hypothetical protein Q7V57_08865 [Actinomycetota bacterium]|nr:hypothetical protein [Actinomycetota bacterium]
MANSEVHPFGELRKWSIVIALGLVAASIGGLLLVHQSGHRVATCSPVTADPQGSTRSCTLPLDSGDVVRPAVLAILTTVLAIGLFTLLLDLRLRRAFGNDLLHFLDLKQATVTSGLTELAPSTAVDFRSEFERLDQITYLGRSPQLWLNSNLPSLLSAAERRKLKITLALPNPDQPATVAECARALGMAAADLKTDIENFQRWVESSWTAAVSRLHLGSALRVVYVDVPPLADAISSSSFSAVMIGKPLHHAAGDESLTFKFWNGADGLPSRWLAESLHPLELANEIFSKEKT